MGNASQKPIQMLTFFMLICRLTSAKPGIALSLLAGAATAQLKCDKGAKCIQKCNVCDQVALELADVVITTRQKIMEFRDVILQQGDAVNYSAFMPKSVTREVKGLVRDVMQDGQCVLQLSAKSAKQVGQEVVIVRPEQLWKDESPANFELRYQKFRKERHWLLVKTGGFNRITDIDLRGHPNKRWCFNSGRAQ